MRPHADSTQYPSEDATPPVGSWAGREVRTIDGKRLGKVGRCFGEYFMVRRSLLSDFWLPTVLVRSDDEEALVLHIAKNFVRRYATDHAPAAEPRGAPADNQRHSAGAA